MDMEGTIDGSKHGSEQAWGIWKTFEGRYIPIRAFHNSPSSKGF